MSRLTGKTITYVMNRESSGCFGAATEALTGVNQDIIHTGLASLGLYDPSEGVTIVPAKIYTRALGNTAVSFGDILPLDDTAFDEDPRLPEQRLATLREALTRDDMRGALLLYPCRRYPDQAPFAHFTAVVPAADATTEAVLAVMDPSELTDVATGKPFGVVFPKTQAEMLRMLQPAEEFGIPVSAYSVHLS